MTRPLGFWGSGGRKEKYGPGGLAVGSSDDIHVSWGPCVVCLAVVYSLSCVFATPWTAAHQAPLSMGFSRQEYWRGWPFPSPGNLAQPGTERGSPILQADSLPTISQSLLKFMSIDLVIPSNHSILCCPPCLLPSIFPRIRVFSNESALPIKWPKY